MKGLSTEMWARCGLRPPRGQPRGDKSPDLALPASGAASVPLTDGTQVEAREASRDPAGISFPGARAAEKGQRMDLGVVGELLA